MKRTIVLVVGLVVGCSGVGGNGADGQQGPPGPEGPVGPQGPKGDPGPSGGDAAKDGSRLRVRTYTQTGEDGSELVTPWGFDDSVYGPCVVVRAADGVMRCLPNGGGSFFYQDAACQVLMVAQPSMPCSPAPAWAMRAAPGAGACGQEFGVYPVGAPVVPAAAWTADANGACVPSVVLSGYSYRSVGAEVDPSEFVAVDTETDP